MSFNKLPLCMFIVGFICLAGCTQNQQTVVKGDSNITQKSDENCRAALEYYKIVNKKGIRSERIDGFLKINEFVIPDIFIFIQQKSMAYRFLINTKKFGETGYSKAEPIELLTDSSTITDEHLNNGWYLGSKIKKETPMCWIFVQWNGGSAFIDNEKFSQIISSPPFNAIYRLGRVNNRLLN